MRIDTKAGSVYLAKVPLSDATDKRPAAAPGARRDHAPVDPAAAWWPAVLGARAGFAARPGAGRITIPFAGGTLTIAESGGWVASVPVAEGVAAHLDLYLPYCVPRPRGLVTAHIGQSLDGRIASESGQSQWLTGEADLVHCHRMRALAEAVVIGARTVREDDPLLTVRRCAGPHPIRVVIDPELSLPREHRLFCDPAARTLVVAADDYARRPGVARHADILFVPRVGGRLSIPAIRDALARIGIFRLFIEGGGITISRFLEAGGLDRLQIAIAPIILGAGRPGVALGGGGTLDRALRPRMRRFDLGDDTLYDCTFDG